MLSKIQSEVEVYNFGYFINFKFYDTAEKCTWSTAKSGGLERDEESRVNHRTKRGGQEVLRTTVTHYSRTYNKEGRSGGVESNCDTL